MLNEKCTILIPARMESSRLPGKALKKIGGIPMIIHVAIRSSQCSLVDRTIVCTDSSDIIFECEKYGIEVCNTRWDHKNGTERIAEAAILLELPDDQIVIDVQGDEPFVSPEYISKVANYVSQSKYGCVVPYQDFEEPDNVNKVKIVSSSDRIVYFSRSDVPNYFGQTSQSMKKHLSIIGFRVGALKKYISAVPGELEEIEKVFKSNWLGKGNYVKDFETGFANNLKTKNEHFLSTSSCTEAIFLASDLSELKQKL